jgi:hypothetical protein
VKLGRIGTSLRDGVGGLGDLHRRESSEIECTRNDVAPVNLAAEVVDCPNNEVG